MKKHKKIYQVMVALSTITQLGLSIALPIVVFLFLAGYLRLKFGLGNYVTVMGILLGVGSGIASLFRFMKLVNKINRRKDD